MSSRRNKPPEYHQNSEIGSDEHEIVRQPPSNLLLYIGIGSCALLAVTGGIGGCMSINGKSESNTDTRAYVPVQTSPTQHTFSPEATPSPTPTQSESISASPTPSRTKQSPSPSPSPSKTIETSPSPSPSPSPIEVSPSPSPSETAPETCAWPPIGGNEYTVGDCGDNKAYGNTDGTGQFYMSEGWPFRAVCIAGQYVQIEVNNDTSYLRNPVAFDVSSLPNC